MDQIRRLSVEFAQIKGLAAAASPQNPNSCSLLFLLASWRRRIGSDRQRSGEVAGAGEDADLPPLPLFCFSNRRRTKQRKKKSPQRSRCTRRPEEVAPCGPYRRRSRSPWWVSAPPSMGVARVPCAWPHAGHFLAETCCAMCFFFLIWISLLCFSDLCLYILRVWIWALGLGRSRF